MKEELIRVENGLFQSDGADYSFDISVARGECIGIYVDEHLTSGTAYLDIFKRYSHIKSGKVFLCGQRAGSMELAKWIGQNTIVIDKYRFHSTELTAWDFLIALGKPACHREKAAAKQRLQSTESMCMLQQMGLNISLDSKLSALSLLDYYRLAIFRVWFIRCELFALDRLTEILRRRDVDRLMQCVQLLLRQGTAALLFDMDEEFMYRYANRIDVIKNRRTCYHLYPEEYDDRLYEILGWKSRQAPTVRGTSSGSEKVILQVSGLTFPSMAPLNFQIRSGEIAFLRDENYNTVSRIRACFLDEQSWESGIFRLDGKQYTHNELIRLIGARIGIQIDRPDRPSDVLFDNLTALDNLSTCLLPKAGRKLIRRKMVENILDEACQWFSREALLQPLCEWPLPQRLRFSYYKWYCINPRLLICFFPFAGQESSHHEMIINMLVTCARRGMAVWVISSGIDAICEKTENKEFLQRLRYINEPG